MKHSLKFSSLIIFATTIASAFTSCGNDSELFEEPVMYQTRAMTRTSMGGEENMRRYVTTNGPSKSIYRIGQTQIEVEFNWSSGFEEYANYRVSNPTLADERIDNGQYVYIYDEREKLESFDAFKTKLGFNEHLAAFVSGLVYEYRYDRINREFDTIEHRLNKKLFIAEKSLGIEYKSYTANNIFSTPTIHTPVNFESNDSLTIDSLIIQNQ